MVAGVHGSAGDRKSMRPKIVSLAKSAMGVVAGIGVGLLMFFAAFRMAGMIMAFGEEGAAPASIFKRIMGPARGAGFVKLSTATVRAVAQGVIGVALIQAFAVG